MKQKLQRLIEVRKELSYDARKEKLQNMFQIFFDNRLSALSDKVEFLTAQTELNALLAHVEHFATFIGVEIPPEQWSNNPYNNKFRDSIGVTGFDEKYDKIGNVYSCFISRIEQTNIDLRDFFALSSELRRIHCNLSDLSLLAGIHNPIKKTA